VTDVEYFVGTTQPLCPRLPARENQNLNQLTSGGGKLYRAARSTAPWLLRASRLKVCVCVRARARGPSNPGCLALVSSMAGLGQEKNKVVPSLPGQYERDTWRYKI
jgi:hypothetical protein